MGSRDAQVYLASPAVVAASAISGEITNISQFSGQKPQGMVVNSVPDETASAPVGMLKDFPETLQGNLIFCHQDNLNTDGIFPSKYTYLDDLSEKQSAAVVMENYDPSFVSLVKSGDILAGGFNFGTGSSREQAATALKHAGISLVIAGSYSATYKRNAINNGVLVLESADFVKFLVNKYGRDKLTVDTMILMTVDFRDSTIDFLNHKFEFHPVGKPAQEIILAGGLENWIKKRL
jgi:homoaconitate hydratase